MAEVLLEERDGFRRLPASAQQAGERHPRPVFLGVRREAVDRLPQELHRLLGVLPPLGALRELEGEVVVAKSRLLQLGKERFCAVSPRHLLREPCLEEHEPRVGQLALLGLGEQGFRVRELPVLHAGPRQLDEQLISRGLLHASSIFSRIAARYRGCIFMGAMRSATAFLKPSSTTLVETPKARLNTSSCERSSPKSRSASITFSMP